MQVPQIGGDADLLLPREVAEAFRVDAKTVTRWAKAGKLPSVRTVGGHRRYPRAEVNRLLRDGFQAQQTVRDYTGTDKS